jgi:hypothetical protein
VCGERCFNRYGQELGRERLDDSMLRAPASAVPN